MPQRNCSKEKQLIAKTSKRVILPLNQEVYNRMVDDHQTYRDYLDTMLVECPELFPSDIQTGYTWHDILSSKKMPEVPLRRIKLKQPDNAGKDQVFTIAPSFVMPYMTGYTDEVADVLFLRGFGVPYWALAHWSQVKVFYKLSRLESAYLERFLAIYSPPRPCVLSLSCVLNMHNVSNLPLADVQHLVCPENWDFV